MELYDQEHFEQQSKIYGKVAVLNDIILARAIDSPSAEILAYPRGNQDAGGYYETFTADQVNRFIDASVSHLLALGYLPSLGRAVGLLGVTDMDYIITLFALSRLGYTVVLLSMRLKPAAIASLLQVTQSDIIVHGTSATAKTTVALTKDIMPIHTLQIVARSDYQASVKKDKTVSTKFFQDEEQTVTSALVFHSSGSTGMPKPVHLKHCDLARSIFTAGMPLDTIVSRPLYHGWGHMCMLSTLYYGKTCYVLDTSTALTTDSLVQAFKAAQPEFVPAVPNNLELLIKDPQGLACLKVAKFVTTGGARITDELGNYLLEQGVKFSSTFGSSEAIGCFGSSMHRAQDDPSWDFVEFFPLFQKHIFMDPIADNRFEVILLGSFPGLATSNSNRPIPGSYRSGDIMMPHPTKPNAWKFLSRQGDFLALSTGEKVLPLPIEDCVIQSPLVQEAIVVGSGKPTPGLLVQPAQDEASGLSESEYLKELWPYVQAANNKVDQFSEIKQNNVYILSPTVELPRTDKGNIVRSEVYRRFSTEIEQLYASSAQV